MNNWRELGAQLRGRRLRLGWTMAEVSEEAGVNIVAVDRLENGTHKNGAGQLDAFMRLADVLRMRVALICDEEDVPAQMQRVVRATRFSTLDDRAAAAVLVQQAAFMAEKKKAATDRIGSRSIDVLVYVKRNPGGVTSRQVAEALGMDRTMANNYLNSLFRTGRIARPERGTYAPYAS